jgi:hypothetical protein
MCILVSRWGYSGSILIPSTSYSQDVVFYPLVNIREGGLATKAAIVIKL